MKSVGGSRAPARRKPRSWSALRSAYHALSGLVWVAPRTPSLKLGVVVVAGLVGAGFVLHLSSVEVALIVVIGVVLLAVETLNTSIEMLCDVVSPGHSPAIAKVKDVAAGATVIIEIGMVVVLAVLLSPRLLRWLT